MSEGKLQEKIVEVFGDAQVGLQHHQKLLKSLKTIYKDGTSEDEFLNVFIELLKHAFIVFKREPAVDRLISFAGYFVGSSEEDFIQEFLKRTLAPFHTARDKAVRFRVAQLTFKILERLGANEEVGLSEELYRIIYKATMVLAFDKVYQVRTQAILCLGRIQDSSDPTCPVVAAMLDRMQIDSSHEVRRCALQNVKPSLVSLPCVVERTRDVKDTIRKTAYSVLAKKFTICNLTISQRIQLLKDGLNDDSAMVKDACILLLFSWLSSFDGDVIALVTKLDVEGSGEVTEMALTHIFKKVNADDLVSAMQGIMQSSDDDVDCQDDNNDHQDNCQDDNNDHQNNNVDCRDDVDQDDDTTKRDLVNSCVIPHNKLTSEAAFFWTCLCTYHHSLGDKGEQHLSKILPTAMEFADYLKRFLHDYLFPAAKDEEVIYERLFVAKQLISLTKLLDLSDEFGRQKLMEFYCETLSIADCTHELTAAILEHIFCLWPQETSCIEKLVGVISEIRQPMESIDPTAAHERELHVAGIKVTLNEYCDQLEKAVDEQDFVMAANYKEKIMEQETLLNAELDHTINSTNTTIAAANISIIDPPEVLHKCLLIAHKLYSNLKMQKLGPVLMTLLETLVLPCVQNEEPVVRNMAFFCLGSASLLDVNQAQKYFHLLLQVSQIDHEMIQATALKMVFDILLLYGTEMFRSGAEDDKDDEGDDEEDDCSAMADLSFSDEAIDKRQDGDEATHKLLKILIDFLDHESIAMREIAGEGLIKLLYSGRVLSQRILARLLLLWFNPVIEDNSILRNLLGTFFPIFASIERCNSECLCEVFVLVLSTVMEAPDTSPLAAIDVNNMADFLLSITTPKTPSDDGHNTLAIAVCHKLLSCCSDGTTGVEVYCRALSRMYLTKDHQTDLASLHVLLNQLKTVVRGQQNLRNIDKFSTALCKLCPASAVNPQSPTHTADSHTPAVASTVPRRVTRTINNTVDKENVEPKTSVRPAAKRTVKKVVLQKTDTIQKSSSRDVLLDQCSSSGSECSDGEDVTVSRQRRSVTTVTKLDYDRTSCSDDDDNDSDDSYLETDSPFVVHTKSKTRSKRQLIVSSEDDT